MRLRNILLRNYYNSILITLRERKSYLKYIIYYYNLIDFNYLSFKRRGFLSLALRFISFLLLNKSVLLLKRLNKFINKFAI